MQRSVLLSPRGAVSRYSAVVVRRFAKKAAQRNEALVLCSDLNGVRTLKMNNPRRFNAWTQPMLQALNHEFQAAKIDSEVKVVVLTGVGEYYCAGVDLSAILKPMHPQTLHDTIYEKNRQVFDTFLDFPKPLIAAVNGPAIGASVTTATLCDALLMSAGATLSTPFARLNVPPEGCSSVHFAAVMGDSNAARMLGPEGWQPTAAEATDAGLAHRVVAFGKQGDGDEDEVSTPGMSAGESCPLLSESQALAETWITHGRLHRSLPGIGSSSPDRMGAALAGSAAEAARASLAEYKVVNDRESKELAREFLGPGFIQAQIDFLTKKGKAKPAAAFKVLLALRPLWAMMLAPEADVLRNKPVKPEVE